MPLPGEFRRRPRCRSAAAPTPAQRLAAFAFRGSGAGARAFSGGFAGRPVAAASASAAAPLLGAALLYGGGERLHAGVRRACRRAGDHRETRTRSAAIKLVIMDSHVVAGVGNIYANEALFHAGIDPRTPAGRVSRERCSRLAQEIKKTLASAIDAGGSSLRDYVGSDGMAGNFQNHFLVYGRAGESCTRCGTVIREIKQAQRATCYCPSCQRR